MPSRLKRYQSQGHDHFITFSCYRRLPLLSDSYARTTFLHTLEHLRQRHQFELHGYVLMPEHVHLLLSEPPHTKLDDIFRALKTQTSRQLKGDRKQFWQTRYYDFNVFTHPKWLEKLHYIHQNPVTRGLVLEPEDWPWSSYHHWRTGEPGTVQIVTQWPEPSKLQGGWPTSRLTTTAGAPHLASEMWVSRTAGDSLPNSSASHLTRRER